jgi:hypothetical protein
MSRNESDYQRPIEEPTNTELLIDRLRDSDSAFFISITDKSKITNVPKWIKEVVANYSLPAVYVEEEKMFYIPRGFLIEKLLQDGYIFSADYLSKRIPSSNAAFHVNEKHVTTKEKTDPENIIGLF